MKISEINIQGHERVCRVEEADSGLIGFIAVHSTALGPAAGGLRMRAYDDEQAALHDVLRLSEGMTYKNAAAALPLGGGKAVIIGDPATQKTPALLRAFAGAIHALNGSYWTAEDMGMSPADMETLAEVTDYVAGLPNGPYASGDPSPVTARGIFNGIRTALRHKTGSDQLAGRRVAVQGLGNVGWHLCAFLIEAEAILTVTDIDPHHVARAVERFGAIAVATDEIYAVEADVFAPCAIGGVLTEAVIRSLRAVVVAGGANNQLPGDAEGDLLHAQNILYAPDFVVNGGGIINVAAELLKVEDRQAWVATHLSALDRTLDQILCDAARRDVSPNRVSKEVVGAAIKRARA